MMSHAQGTAERGLFTFDALCFTLAVLFLGPLVAPLLQASALPLAADSGALARDLLSRYVCPTPVKSYVLLGFPMAVCARCWGATLGLWGAWLLFRSQAAGFILKLSPKGRRSQMSHNQEPSGGRPSGNHPQDSGSWFSVSSLRSRACLGSWFFDAPWALRLGLAIGALLLWRLEINLWPSAPLPILLLNGANGGFWAAMCVGSFWAAWRSAAIGY